MCARAFGKNEKEIQRKKENKNIAETRVIGQINTMRAPAVENSMKR